MKQILIRDKKVDILMKMLLKLIKKQSLITIKIQLIWTQINHKNNSKTNTKNSVGNFMKTMTSMSICKN